MTTQSTIIEPNSISANAESTAVKPKRYHFVLVALHWLIALLIFGTVFLIQGNEEGRERFEGQRRNFSQQGFQQGIPSQGFQPGDQTPGFPQGGFPARGTGQSVFSTTGIHMVIGFIILVLLLARLIVRWTTKHPDWASAGNKFFDWIGNLTHIGLYLLTFAVVITGIILADQRGILARTFGIGSTPTLGSFGRGGFSLGFLHGGMWTLLLLLIVLHIGAALYHQFILKDNLLGRMWFGKETDN
jgi:cytochrome b561